MMTDEYVTASDLKAIEQRVNREAQQTMQHLMTLQGRIDMLQSLFNELDRKIDYKQPAQQSVADFERSQSLNALNQKADSDAKCSSETLRPDPNWAWFDTSKWDQKPTPADLESEIAKSFMEWLRTGIPNSGLFSAFQAGVKFGQSKPLPKQTL